MGTVVAVLCFVQARVLGEVLSSQKLRNLRKKRGAPSIVARVRGLMEVSIHDPETFIRQPCSISSLPLVHKKARFFQMNSVLPYSTGRVHIHQ